MRKIITLILYATLALALAACGAAAASNSTSATGDQTTAGTPVPNASL
ncbi:MAG: hypothetical protein HW378_4744, partial [Anaerolineales bacterium]|nr:hypothetical protein [Anaerolineales bacterium]